MSVFRGSDNTLRDSAELKTTNSWFSRIRWRLCGPQSWKLGIQTSLTQLIRLDRQPYDSQHEVTSAMLHSVLLLVLIGKLTLGLSPRSISTLAGDCALQAFLIEVRHVCVDEVRRVSTGGCDPLPNINQGGECGGEGITKKYN